MTNVSGLSSRSEIPEHVYVLMDKVERAKENKSPDGEGA